MHYPVRAGAAGLLAVWHGAEAQAGEVWVEVGEEWVEVGEEQVEVEEERIGIEGKVVGMWGEGVSLVNGYFTYGRFLADAWESDGLSRIWMFEVHRG